MHQHEHDVTDRHLRTATLAFVVFGLFQLIVALSSLRIALAVDGLHNMFEYTVVGINRKGRQWIKLPPGVRACWLGPLAPALSSIVAVTGAVAFLSLGLTHEPDANTLVALVLVMASFGINALFARKLGQSDHHQDPNAEGAFWHFAGDSASSLVAAVAYAWIAVSGSHLWLDPAAAIAGTIIIVLVHIAPTAKSIRTFVRHHGGGHHHH